MDQDQLRKLPTLLFPKAKPPAAAMATPAKLLRMTAIAAAAKAAAAASPTPAEDAPEDAGVVGQFEEYTRAHGKQYRGDEWVERLANFRESLRAIELHATRSRSHTLHLNELADVSGADFARLHLGLRAGPSGGPALREADSLGVHRAGAAAGLLGTYVLPPSMDWRERGVVNPPRQQSGCGACWTFASSSALASAWGIASEQMVNLSQQQLLDCAGAEYGNDGCLGGAFDGTYTYAQAAPLCTSESYPYVAVERTCRQDCAVGVPRGAVLGYRHVEIGSEAALMDAVTRQPVTVGIMVAEQGPGLKLYQGGIFSGDCTSQPNHAVVVVGYGTDNQQGYWLIQNSWGTSWGEGGYFRLARGSGPDGMGECGILSMPTYPVVDLVAEASTVATTTLGEGPHSTEEPEASTVATTAVGEGSHSTEEPESAAGPADFLV